jgi:hypothetical protein
MDPEQTLQMRRLVWIHAGSKRNMLVLSWRGSIMNGQYNLKFLPFEKVLLHVVLKTKLNNAKYGLVFSS